MDLQMIRSLLKDIKDFKKDFELAHSTEDFLYHKFVEHVSKQDGDLGEMAKEILKSKDIDFLRTCA